MSTGPGNRAEGASAIPKLRRVLTAWGSSHGRAFPWRVTPDAYQRLLAEVLLQRTRAASVLSIWPVVVDRFPTTAALAAATTSEIAAAIRTLGLADKRADQLRRLGLALGGDPIPEDPASLLELPGVGPYSSAAFLTSWKGTRTGPVDANVRRVLGRVVCGVDSIDRRRAESLVGALLRRGDARKILFGLLDFGASPCRPRRASCQGCPAGSFCQYATKAMADAQGAGETGRTSTTYAELV